MVRDYETEPDSHETVVRRVQPFKGARNTFFEIYNNPQSVFDKQNSLSYSF